MELSEVWPVSWRTALALVIVTLGGLASFLLGLGAQPFAWVLAPLALAALAVAVVRAMWSGRDERTLAASIAAVLAAALGILVWAASPAGHLLLVWHLDDVELPPGARLVDEHRTGNVWCFDYCPSVSRSYHVEGDPGPIADHIEDALAGSGLRVTRRDAEGASFSTDPEGDIRLTVDVHPAARYPATGDHPEPERIPGTTEITVTATAQQPI